ncbi:hypothetical protein GCM10018780_88540 [Streptomyces lanatus]|nr:hypothetical protein GCM10018780_88540 [Streptomyces lanatus]
MFRIPDFDREQPRWPSFRAPRPSARCDAVVAFSGARAHAQMEHAVATLPVIGGAMGSPDLTEEQAFEVLRRYSQEHNVTLREVARLVCEQGSHS